MINFSIALDEHKKIFPRATPRSQLLKLNEELHEYETATSLKESYLEYGDFLFVCISLRRFKMTGVIAEALLDKYYFSYPVEEQKTFMKYLQIAVEKSKMRVSRKDYYFKNGKYDRDRGGDENVQKTS